MNLRKKLIGFCFLVSLFASSIKLYAMDEQSCCDRMFSALTKMFQDKHVADDESGAAGYRAMLDREYVVYQDIWNRCPNENNTSVMAQSALKRGAFEILSRKYPFDVAKKMLEEKVKAGVFLQGPDYKNWLWNNTLKGKTIPCPYKIPNMSGEEMEAGVLLQDLESDKLMHGQALLNRVCAQLYLEVDLEQKIVEGKRKQD